MKKHTKRQKKVDPSYLEGSRVKTSFKKHFMPPLTGALVGFGVLMLLNTQFLATKAANITYQAPVAVAAQDETTKKAKPNPNAPAQIIINGIKVKAPVMYNQKTVNETNFQIALRSGVVHYPNTSVPGVRGNVVIFGHSSGQVWAPGKYKFVFTHLDKLKGGDKIFVDYQGTRYTYEVKAKKVVAPSDVTVLGQTTDNILTLITCTPVGTSKNRLIVTAKQIDPIPEHEQKPTTTQQPALTEQELPNSESPSLWDSIKALF
jgi:sortase A